MRDRRFVALHRGGPLTPQSHAFLARWAADCAERVLHFFTDGSDDPRPKQALEIARSWADGAVKTGVAMKASVAAHAAAREAPSKAATAAARAAAQAVATGHCADHCMGALLYAMKALKESGSPSNTEMELQLSKLPDDLRAPVWEGVQARLIPFRVGRFLKSDVRRPQSRAQSVTLKRKIFVSIAVLLILLFCGFLYLWWPFRTIRRLQTRYEQVQRGMNVEEVQALMAHSPIHASDQWVPLWDDERLPPAEAERIVSALRYSVKAFYLPVSFEFTFDSQQRLVGKHRYD